MSFRMPTVNDIEALSAELGMPLDEAAAATMHGFMTPLLEGFADLDAEPDELPAVKYPSRSWRWPAQEENPLGGWYVKTSIKGAATGPLAGRTVAVKDVIFVADVPMACGTSVLEGFVPDFDATVVTRLLDAGADVTGKSVCEYFCVSGSSVTASTGIVDNPCKTGYAAGGSSSGSAALVGAGLVDMALGSDQAGSVRCPASWSGICGMKPTFGLVPYTGAMGQEACLDHLGPMTSSVTDNALMLEVLAGYDGFDGRQKRLVVHRYTEALGQSVAGLRIGIVREGFGQRRSEPQVDECVRAAADRLSKLGARVGEVAVPAHLTGINVWAGILGDGLWLTLKLAGLGYDHDGVYSPALFRAMRCWLDRLGETPVNVRMLALMGRYLERYDGEYYYKAKNLSRRLRAAYDEALDDYDLLLMPTARVRPLAYPGRGKPMTDEQIIAHALSNLENTCPFDVTGHPAMSVPCGMRDGLPIGMMLIGRHFDEPTIYRAAHAFEQSGDWREM